MDKVEGDVKNVRYTKADAIAKKHKKRQLWVLEQQKNSHLSTVLLGVLILIFTFGIGGAFVLCGLLYGLYDLFIPGGIFLAGGVVFVFVFGISNCKHYFFKRRVHAKLEKDIAEAESHAGGERRTGATNVHKIKVTP